MAATVPGPKALGQINEADLREKIQLFRAALKNQMKHLDSFTLKRGTVVFEGRVAPFDGHPGGGRQILIPGKLEEALEFKERIK